MQQGNGDEEVLQDRADRRVVRVGATVHHPVQPWTPSVHALLKHLEEVGFPYSPRVVEVRGETEILTYLPGESGAAGSMKALHLEGLRAMGRLLREYHDAVAGWNPPEPPTWADGRTGTGGPGELVCHGDFAPWNIVWDGFRPVGLLDWEYANPARPVQDVAWALEFTAPFRDDETAVTVMRHPEPPNRRERMETLAEAYGLTSTEGLVDEVIALQRIARQTLLQLAAAGHERQQTALANGELEEHDRLIAWSEAHRHLFT